MPTKYTLTPEQQSVISAPRMPITVVQAGAGTGKTQVLVERILKLLNDDSVKIAVLPYGKRVAEEIRQRLHQAGINTNSGRVYVSTLHALCYEYFKNTIKNETAVLQICMF